MALSTSIPNNEQRSKKSKRDSFLDKHVIFHLPFLAIVQLETIPISKAHKINNVEHSKLLIVRKTSATQTDFHRRQELLSNV